MVGSSENLKRKGSMTLKKAVIFAGLVFEKVEEEKNQRRPMVKDRFYYSISWHFRIKVFKLVSYFNDKSIAQFF